MGARRGGGLRGDDDHLSFIANQAWAFIAPGLYRNEKKAFLPFLFMTPVLFSLGVAGAYYMMPLALKALLIGPFSLIEGNHSLGLAVTPDVQKYLSFVRQLLFAFGFAFLLPIAILLSNRAGLLPIETLQKGRRYAIVIAFALAAVLTPPDVTSQFLLAIPLIILYELSIVFIRIFYKPLAKAAPDDTSPQLPAPDNR
nr:twin-arginine translocase subunit TatC [Hankyongella ginsenosidimutans]